MKKHISIVLILCLLLSSFTYAFGTPKDVLGTDFEEAVAAMTSLGIIDGFPDGTYRAQDLVTRAQMAKMLIIALGYEDITVGMQSQFPDVNGHWAESYISMATALDIIQGYPEGTFKPNNNVSFNEAITMSMRALGYVDEGLKGNWPTNYLLKAYDLKLLEDVDTNSGYADRGNVAKLIYNALYTEYVQLDENGIFAINSNGEKLIQKLVETEEILLEYDHVFGDDKLDSIVKLEDYLFQNVSVYKNRSGQIIHVEKSLSNVLLGRINSTSTSSNIRIEVEGKSVYQDVPLDENVRIIYNSFYDGKDQHTGITSGGTIDIVWQDRNGNGRIDVGEVDGIIIDKQDNKFVVTDEFNSSTFEIKGRKSFSLSTYETVIIPTLKDEKNRDVVDVDSLMISGDAKNLEDIKEKDVLYVYSSRDGKKLHLYTVRETITGVIQEIITDNTIDTSSSYGKVYINDKVISLAGYFRPYYERYADRWAVNAESTQDKFVPGAEVVLVLDDVGYVYSYYLLQEAEGQDIAGLVIATKNGSITEEDDGFVGDEFNVILPKMQVVDQDGTIRTFNVEKDADYVVSGTPTYDSETDITKTTLSINLNKRDIVEFKLNEENNIKSITKINLDINLADVNVNKNINVIDRQYLYDSNTVIFSAIGPAQDWKTLSSGKIPDMITGVALLKDDDFTVDVVRIDNGLYDTPVGEGVFAVIQSMSFVLGDNDKEVAKVRVYEKGTTKTYYTDSDNSRIFIDQNNEFFELILNDDNEIVGKMQVEESSDNVENVFELSRIKGVYNDNSIISISDAFNETEGRLKVLSDDVIVYRLNYDGKALQEITLGSKADLIEGRIVKGYDVNVDKDEAYDIVFVATNKDVAFEDLPTFMVYDIAFADGRGTQEDPYIIMTASHLKNVTSDLEAYYKMKSNVDLSSVENWTPIGDFSYPFEGYFDGNGYGISNLRINNVGKNYSGLFGYVQDASILNLNITNADIEGSGYSGVLAGRIIDSVVENCRTLGSIKGTDRVGGLVGVNQGSSIIKYSSAEVSVSGTARVGGLVGYNWYSSSSPTVENSYASGDVVGGNASFHYTGGLVGWNNQGLIKDSYATGQVTAPYRAGGLVGYNSASGLIDRSYATGNVIGTEDDSSRLGGLVGYNNASTISSSYSIGNVTSSNDFASTTNQIGGLVGDHLSGKIQNSYSTAQVIGSKQVGGLVGNSRTDSIITNSYSTGQVTGSEEIGGFVGLKDVTATITDSYWDKDTSFLAISDGGEGKTTIEMQAAATFTTWDTNIWDIVDGSYPSLSWE